MRKFGRLGMAAALLAIAVLGQAGARAPGDAAVRFTDVRDALVQGPPPMPQSQPFLEVFGAKSAGIRIDGAEEANHGRLMRLGGGADASAVVE